MFAIIVTMGIVLGVALLALGYAAFPHRGERIPGAPWLSDVVERAADAVPVISDGDIDDRRTHEPAAR
ncbi:hypothetical protein [Nocardioides sp. GXZ039]|uniref:hypothetical protein n=1 Tax=Nocardioides sp. GXZ039 TaxID=3136018 RepID=UPI0030F3A5E1